MENPGAMMAGNVRERNSGGGARLTPLPRASAAAAAAAAALVTNENFFYINFTKHNLIHRISVDFSWLYTNLYE